MNGIRHDSAHSPANSEDVRNEAIERQAAEWRIRRDRGLDADEALRLDAWLGQDQAHRAAVDRLGEVSQLLDTLPAERVDALRREVARMHDERRARQPSVETAERFRRWLRRGALVAVAAAVVGAMWGVVNLVVPQPTYSHQFATARGESSRFTLPDGSELYLDAASRARVRLYEDRREVQLADGQGLFSVTPDAQRPFHVLAGKTRVMVVGTRFAVRNIDAEVSVAVEEGKVRVAGGGTGKSDATAVELGAGEAVRTDSSGVPGAVARVAPGAVAPWREGRVVFDATPLARAVAEFARYGDLRLEVRDPAVAALRVTGSFDIAQVERFARALPLVLPVRLVERDGATEIVAR